MSRPLRLLLLVNALATFAAASGLAFAPGLIPGTVGIALPANARFVTDLLAAAELATAVLCIMALRATTPEAIRLAVVTLVVLHVASGLFGLLALAQGTGGAVLAANIAIRFAMAALLAIFGLRVQRA